MKKLIAGLAVVAAGHAQAITVLSEGFANVPALASAGWTFVNNSATPVGLNWFQGNTGIFSAAAGAADSYAAVNYLSTGASSGAVSNWLIMPTLTLDSSSVLTFSVRNGGDDFLDKLEIRYSTTGTSVGSTTTSVGDFTNILGAYQSSVSPGGWITLSYSLLGLTSPTSVSLAFRYVVDDVATAGNYLGIDSVSVTAAVPEPATYVLMGLGVAALMLRRRMPV
jgi:hypothetical protein